MVVSSCDTCNRRQSRNYNGDLDETNHTVHGTQCGATRNAAAVYSRRHLREGYRRRLCQLAAVIQAECEYFPIICTHHLAANHHQDEKEKEQGR